MNPEAGSFYFSKSDCTLWYCATACIHFDCVSLDKVNKSSDEDGSCFYPIELFAKDFKKVALLINEEAK
jgi:hypothetical protein